MSSTTPEDSLLVSPLQSSHNVRSGSVGSDKTPLSLVPQDADIKAYIFAFDALTKTHYGRKCIRALRDTEGVHVLTPSTISGLPNESTLLKTVGAIAVAIGAVSTCAFVS